MKKLGLFSSVLLVVVLAIPNFSLGQSVWSGPAVPFSASVPAPALPISEGSKAQAKKDYILLPQLKLSTETLDGYPNIPQINSLVLDIGKSISWGASNLSAISGGIFNFIGNGLKLPSLGIPLVPMEGTVYYDSTTKEVKLYDGTDWKSIGSGAAGGGTSQWQNVTNGIAFPHAPELVADPRRNIGGSNLYLNNDQDTANQYCLEELNLGFGDIGTVATAYGLAQYSGGWGGTSGGSRIVTLNCRSSADNVGIGTANPGYPLDVNGIVNATAFYQNGAPFNGSKWVNNTTAGIRYPGTGNVGIGLFEPSERFEINGGAPTRLRITDTDAGENPELQLQYGPSSDNHWGIYTAFNGDETIQRNELKIWNEFGGDIVTITPETVGGVAFNIKEDGILIPVANAVVVPTEILPARFSVKGQFCINGVCRSDWPTVAPGGTTFDGLLQGPDLTLKAPTTNPNDSGDVVFQNSSAVQKGRIWTDASTDARLNFSSGDITPDLTINSAGLVEINGPGTDGGLRLNGRPIYTLSGPEDPYYYIKSSTTYLGGLIAQHYGGFHFKTQLEQERLTVTEDGNVGIDNINPSNTLDVGSYNGKNFWWNGSKPTPTYSQYSLNYTQAQNVCSVQGGRLAKYAEVVDAWKNGFQQCSYGWVEEGFTLFPIKTPSGGCGTKDGINFGDRVGPADAYCAKDTAVVRGGTNIGQISTRGITIGGGPEQQDAPVTALSILGPNQPVNSNGAQDIKWQFNAAGSAGIRAYRGGSWDTNLQFLTNPAVPTGNNPQVRMTINSDGNVGIGTDSPTKKLEVNGGSLSIKSGGIYFESPEFGAAPALGGVTSLTGVSGNLSGGDYYYAVTYGGEDRGGETKTNGFSAGGTSLASLGATVFKIDEPSDSRIKSFYIYRAPSSGLESAYKRIGVFNLPKNSGDSVSGPAGKLVKCPFTIESFSCSAGYAFVNSANYIETVGLPPYPTFSAGFFLKSENEGDYKSMLNFVRQTVDNRSFVGLNTDRPSQMLEILGVGSVSRASLSNELGDPTDGKTARVRITDTNGNPELQLQYGTSTNDHWGIYADHYTKNLVFWNGENRLFIKPNGHITANEIFIDGSNIETNPANWSKFSGGNFWANVSVSSPNISSNHLQALGRVDLNRPGEIYANDPSGGGKSIVFQIVGAAYCILGDTNQCYGGFGEQPYFENTNLLCPKGYSPRSALSSSGMVFCTAP
jgi:hypothetical protein